MFLIGETQRSISSTAPGISPAGSADKPRHLVRVGQQLLHAPADDVAGRLVAADQDQQGLVDERLVVERVAVYLGMAEHADEVVAVATGSPVLEDRMDVLGVLDERVGRVEHGVGVGGALALEHVVGPPQQVVAVVGRHAEHVADHDDGQRRRDVAHEVAATCCADLCR